jgi:hypothetical protein
MTAPALRRLPSTDRIAVAVALAAMALQYVLPSSFALIALAVFAPSVLRELGLLHDGDEWTSAVTHRAGFHGLLAVVMILTVNRLAVATGAFAPTALTAWPFNHEMVWKAAVWVFVVSTLVQYWGARAGVFRLLLILVATTLAGLVGAARTLESEDLALGLGAPLGFAAILLILAALVQRRPRAAGVTLLALFGAMVVITMRTIQTLPENTPSPATWGLVGAILQVGLFFGVTGVALVRETPRGAVRTDEQDGS